MIVSRVQSIVKILGVIRAGIQGLQGFVDVSGIELGRWAGSQEVVGTEMFLALREAEHGVGGGRDQGMIAVGGSGLPVGVARGIPGGPWCCVFASSFQ